MKKITLGILAHVDSGKTTLSEALLYCSGNIKKLGRVDHGNSFLDTYSVERDRGITVFSKQAIMRYQNTEFTLLDTPGHVDFSAETERTLQVLDYAVLVISGTDGVQSHTVTLWKLLQKYEVPCFLFVNKMDLDGADKELILNGLKNKLSDGCIDFSYTDDNILYENAALCDEQLLEKFDNGTLNTTDLMDAISSRKIFPCMFGSALKLSGINELIECLENYTKMPVYKSEFAAKVYKITEDRQKNRLTFLKVTGGTLKVRSIPDSPANSDHEKINQIRIYSGEKFITQDEAEAGTVCAVTGLNFTKPGLCLGAEPESITPVLQPVLNYTVELPPKMNVHTALEQLKLLEDEDPQLNILWNESTGSIQIRIMGEIQLEILKRMISERFGFEVSFGTGSIIYKETIADIVEGVGHFEPLRHYAEVHLLMKPAKRNSGLIFTSDCREEILDKNRQKLILTSLYEKTHIGVLTGSPITDMEIILVSGKDHTKHTVGGDFREASCRAVRQGLRSAKSVLLEPVYEFILEIPSENAGRAIADLQRMYASFEPPETFGETSIINGSAPVSEMSQYSREVIRYTHGKGRLNCSFKGYEPCHNSEDVIASFGYDPDRDTENPCDSVFCSHGAGHIVKWNEVKDHMHLSAFLDNRNSPVDYSSKEKMFSGITSQSDIFAADKELMQIFEQTYGPVKKRNVSRQQEYIASPAVRENVRTTKNTSKYTGEEYLLVDGYNVIFAWDELKKIALTNLDSARNTLINILCNYRGYRKCHLILVFDAYKVKGNQREVERTGDIDIVYTKEAETADMYIEKTTHQLAGNHRVIVVTSDGMEQLIILGNGALRISSQAFLSEVKQAEEEIRTIIMQEHYQGNGCSS